MALKEAGAEPNQIYYYKLGVEPESEEDSKLIDPFAIQTGNSLNFLTDIGPFKNKELKYLVYIN